MKKLLGIILAGALLFGLTGIAAADNEDSHNVTVNVEAINELAISGGNITLTINSANAGSQPIDATDNTMCDLKWTTNQTSKKITVATDNDSQNFTLKVAAQGVNGGTAASEVILDTSAQNFVTGISETLGICDLSYTASATASQGTGSDEHEVTYTLTDQ